jgi:serine/threonine protein kinase
VTRTIGRYRIIEVVNHRSSGDVCKATDLADGRTVMVQTFQLGVPRESAEHERRLERFHDAARRWALLSHPNIVALWHSGEEDGVPYLVLEYVEHAEILVSLLEGGHRFDPEYALVVAGQIASALDYAHSLGVVHGCLRPSTVLLTGFLVSRSPVAKLTGFGLGPFADPDDASRPEAALEAASYMSPEQVVGREPDTASDVFSLGLCTFAMLSGEQPFRGSDPSSSLPTVWQPVFGRVLAKSPGARYAKAIEFVEELESRLDAVFPSRSTRTPASAPDDFDDLSLEVDSDESPTLMNIPSPAASAPPRPIASAPATSFEPRHHSLPRKSAGGPGLRSRVTGVLEVVRDGAGAVVRSVKRGLRRQPTPPIAVGPEVRVRRSGTGISSDGNVDPVDATVYAPPLARPGETLLIQVFAHMPEQAAEADDLARQFDAEAERRGYRSLETPVARGSRLAFDLHMPGLAIDQPVQSLVWNGRPQSVQFGVTIPAGHPVGTVLGTVTVSQASVPVGHIKFKLAVDAAGAALDHAARPVGDDARHYELAFVSYASKDRDKVLARVQMLESLKIRYFQDVLSLDPGDRWQQQLYKHIDQCDLFLLFWSTAARESPWVMKEVDYALGRKHGDDLAPPEIKPVIIEGPPPVPPPPELAHLHFDDRVIYFLGGWPS